MAVIRPALAAKIKYGQLELTTPDAYPVTLDGENDPPVQVVNNTRIYRLTPGIHMLEVVLPNGQHWVHKITVRPGGRICVTLHYQAERNELESGFFRGNEP
jgi:hypothetical protein